MTDLQALLFDFDGVLADTEPLHWRSWASVLAPLGIDLTWQTYQERCIGVSDSNMAASFEAVSGVHLSMDQLRALYPLKRKAFADEAQSVDLVSDELLELIKSLDYLQLGVVTSSNRAEIEPILQREKILAFLDVVVYGNDVKRYKPDPEPYLLALERLGVAGGRAVVFEDSVAGLESARSAGCRVVPVRHPGEVVDLVRGVLAG